MKNEHCVRFQTRTKDRRVQVKDCIELPSGNGRRPTLQMKALAADSKLQVNRYYPSAQKPLGETAAVTFEPAGEDDSDANSSALNGPIKNLVLCRCQEKFLIVVLSHLERFRFREIRGIRGRLLEPFFPGLHLRHVRVKLRYRV